MIALFKKHPKREYQTLINYNLAIMMIPPMMIGSMVGSVLAGIVPASFQLGLLAIIVVVSMLKTFRKAMERWKEESKAIQAEAEKKKKEEEGAKDEEVGKARKIEIEGQAANLVKEMPIGNKNDEKHDKKEKCNFEVEPTGEIPQERKAHCGAPPLNPGDMVTIKNFEMDPVPNESKPALISPKKAAFSSKTAQKKPSADTPEVAALKWNEGRNFNPGKKFIAVAAIVLSLGLILLKGGKQFESLIGLERCEPLEWVISFIYIMITMSLVLLSGWIVKREQTSRKKAGWAYEDDEVQLTTSTMIQLQFIALLVGVVATMIGIGGSTLMTPILLSYNYMPQVISKTVIYLIFLNKAVVVAVFLSSGVMPMDYLLILAAIFMICVGLSQWKLAEIIQNTGRQSIISFMFVGVMALGLGLISFSLVSDVIKDPSGITEFKNYCNA
jgi:uncharacterized membrane protein YfcA